MSAFLVGGWGPGALGGEAQGVSRVDGDTVSLEIALPNPSFLLRVGDRVYAADEIDNRVATWIAGDPSTLVTVPTPGMGPCHLALSNGSLLVACYVSGHVNVHPLDADGVPGEATQSLEGEGSGPKPPQDSSHAHATHEFPDGRVLSLDLGADRVHEHLWRDGVLERVDSIEVPPGSGPRDALTLADGRIVVLAELSGELIVFEERGPSLEIVQILPLPGWADGHAAALARSADGRLLFAGMRGADAVAVVAVDPDTLRPVGSVPSGGAWPRHLTVVGDELYVANQHSGWISRFRVTDALPEPVGESIPVPSPTYVLPLG